MTKVLAQSQDLSGLFIQHRSIVCLVLGNTKAVANKRKSLLSWSFHSFGGGEKEEEEGEREGEEEEKEEEAGRGGEGRKKKEEERGVEIEKRRESHLGSFKWKEEK